MLQQLFIFGSWKKSLQERDKNAFDLIDSSASAALSKKSISDYFSERWLSHKPQLRQDVCDNHDRE